MNAMCRAGLLLAALSSVAMAADVPGRPPAIENSIGMRLVRIEPGEFTMGCGLLPPTTREQWDERDWDESPAHRVRISKPLYVGATEVTNAQYERFDPEHRKLRGLHGISTEDDQPVVLVGWQQAVDFCAWLSKREGRPYRLPTEAEWEYACRAGTTTRYGTGDTLTPAQANFGPVEGRRLGPVAVGSFAPNPWGLYDMHGNVAEWCLDWYGPYDAAAQTDPVGRADGTARVVRGWSFQPAAHRLGAARYCRSSNRSGHLPEDANSRTGFRVVLGELPATAPLPVGDRPIHQRDVRQTPAARKVPDPAEPYFADVAPDVTIPRDRWGPIFGQWNHFSAIAVCPNGDVLVAWYTTVSEEGRECAQAAARWRADTGRWDAPDFFFGTPDCNTHAPVLLCDGRRLYHFCTQSLQGWDDAAECLRTSDDNGATWSRPRIILSREAPRSMSQPCSALVAQGGELVVAVDGDFGHRDERVMTSKDRGATWEVGAGDMRAAVGRYAIHPALVQRAAGARLAFLRGPHPMPAVVSADGGQSWQVHPTPLPGIGVGQKAAAIRLAGGGLLVCSFDNKRTIFPEVDGSPTLAALSYDDGRTWPHVRRVEGPGGYLSVAQSPEGLIYLAGLGRGEPRMRCVAFNEAWLKQGRPLP